MYSFGFLLPKRKSFFNRNWVEQSNRKDGVGPSVRSDIHASTPLLFDSTRPEKTLLIGMLAWVLRYLLFAYGNADEKTAMLIVGILLHGICYDFFFVTGQIYTDAKAGPKIKSAAQGLITLATYGIGMLIGFWSAGKIYDAYTIEGVNQWKDIWLAPAGFAFLILVLFLLVFKNEKIEVNE